VPGDDKPAILETEQESLKRRVDRLDYAVFGLDGTDEKGLLGEMREIVQKIDRLTSVWALGSVGIVVSGISIAVSIALH